MMTTPSTTTSSTDLAASLEIIEVKPGVRFSIATLRSFLPDVETLLFFGKVYELDYRQVSNLLLKVLRTDVSTALFGEGPGGIVVSGPRAALLELSAKAAGIGFLALGQVGGSAIDLAAPAARLGISVEDAGDLFDSVLTNRVS